MRTSVIVIGAGHTGLAVSYFLRQQGINHVVFERGHVGHSWRTERWDSLRMLTPNWQNRLPGAPYSGTDPDGYMTMTDVAEFLGDYAEQIDAPVRTGVTVTSVRRNGADFQVDTTIGAWTAPAVVIATGACNIPKIPALAKDVPAGITQLTPKDYRNPEQLDDGGVLVVGAAATGAQIAAEVRASGRAVTLAVGEHVRMPRTYRGHDILWWMERSGIWSQRFDQLDDIVRARHLPSPQLVGSTDKVTLDLNYLTDLGVQLAGRLAGISNGVAQFSGSLTNVIALADLKARRLLHTFDEFASSEGLDANLPASETLADTHVPAKPPLARSLTDGAITSIIWATGYTADYSFLDIDVLDHKGQLKHDGGIVTDAPGLYRIGLPVLRRRNSTFVNGAEADAHEITDHLARYLGSNRVSSAAADNELPAYDAVLARSAS
ncbi:MAG: NAD(P)-binding domain-containing protein [Nakamurella sp.]